MLYLKNLIFSIKGGLYRVFTSKQEFQAFSQQSELIEYKKAGIILEYNE